MAQFSIISSAAPAAVSLTGSTLPKPKNAAEAAKQFEGLLIAQMLRSAREVAGSESDDPTAETMFDVAGQQFAQMLADRGGLGLAKLIAKGLGQTGS
jgi:Rod binding domain-containing protein